MMCPPLIVSQCNGSSEGRISVLHSVLGEVAARRRRTARPEGTCGKPNPQRHDQNNQCDGDQPSLLLCHSIFSIPLRSHHRSPPERFLRVLSSCWPCAE